MCAAGLLSRQQFTTRNCYRIASYKIYDGTAATGKLLKSVTVNQRKAPVGTANGDTKFQQLGDFDVTSGTLTVVLTSHSANGTVVADTIGIAQAWASGGGQSLYESKPSYQLGVQKTGFRTTPDVSFDGSIYSGVTVYQDGQLGYHSAGTSLACPCWAGLIAIVDQGRVADGGTTLNSPTDPTQALQALYSLSARDFHDITSGYNGSTAGVGYDEVTGRGSPVANLLVPALVSYEMPGRLKISSQPPARITIGSGFGLRVTVEDSRGKILGYNGEVTITLARNPGAASLGGTLVATAVDGVANFSRLTLNAAGDGYKLEATVGNQVTATTRDLDVIPVRQPVKAAGAGGFPIHSSPNIFMCHNFSNFLN